MRSRLEESKGVGSIHTGAEKEGENWREDNVSSVSGGMVQMNRSRMANQDFQGMV